MKFGVFVPKYLLYRLRKCEIKIKIFGRVIENLLREYIFYALCTYDASDFPSLPAALLSVSQYSSSSATPSAPIQTSQGTLSRSQAPPLHGSQTTLKTATLSATCASCLKPFNLRQDGQLRVHGPSGAHCPGSGELPLAASLAPGSAPTSSDTDPLAFAPLRPHRSTLKSLPRGAHQRAAIVFEDRVKGVTCNQKNMVSWTRLLEFGTCLAQPE